MSETSTETKKRGNTTEEIIRVVDEREETSPMSSPVETGNPRNSPSNTDKYWTGLELRSFNSAMEAESNRVNILADQIQTIATLMQGDRELLQSVAVTMDKVTEKLLEVTIALVDLAAKIKAQPLK